jgi:CcmD family protein
MTTFVIAYLIVWAGVLLYLLQLGARQRRLEQSFRSLQLLLRPMQQPGDPARSEAA